jgi:hypothetical protein
MPAIILRSYKVKDVDFLVTSSTIVENAIANKKFLLSKRPTWADPYFDNVKLRIENATQTHLGVDSAKDLRQATQSLTAIQKQALAALSECKVQIAEDFKKVKIRRDEILNLLGFKAYHAKAQKEDQEALINLLYQFKTNMTAVLKSEIMTKGMAAEAIDEIIGYADGLMNANITQETFKGLRKDVTAAAVKEFNEIYDEIISIGKIAARFFKDKPAKKDLFSFSKVARALNAQKAPKPSNKK